jgi:hypothetical protein
MWRALRRTLKKLVKEEKEKEKEEKEKEVEKEKEKEEKEKKEGRIRKTWRKRSVGLHS